LVACPLRSVGYDRINIAPKPLGMWPQCLIPRVADRDKNVSDEAVAANSLDRRAGEGGPERTIIQRNEVTQMGGREVRSRYDLRMRGGMSKAVPGTNGEAVIATIYSVAHQRSELVRYRAGMLDCQV
jgi:hypothetical protein